MVGETEETAKNGLTVRVIPLTARSRPCTTSSAQIVTSKYTKSKIPTSTIPVGSSRRFDTLGYKTAPNSAKKPKTNLNLKHPYERTRHRVRQCSSSWFFAYMKLYNHNEVSSLDCAWSNRGIVAVEIYSTSCTVAILGHEVYQSVRVKEIITVSDDIKQVHIFKSAALENWH